MKLTAIVFYLLIALFHEIQCVINKILLIGYGFSKAIAVAIDCFRKPLFNVSLRNAIQTFIINKIEYI